MSKILVIIPAYNEAENIGGVVRAVFRHTPDFNVVVINDGSTDDTSRLAAAAGARVINLPENLGVGIALSAGYRYARQNGYDYVVQLDGDGQHDPADIKNVILPVVAGEADFTIGSRFLGKLEYPLPRTKIIGIRFFSFLTKQLTDKKITDTTSGFRAFNIKAIDLMLERDIPADYPDADLIISLIKAKIRVKEVAATFYPNRQNRYMHSGFKPVYYIYKMLLSIAAVTITSLGTDEI